MRAAAHVRDIMSRRPKTVMGGVTVAAAAEEMLAGAFRHLPVVENGRVVGMLSDRDVLRHRPPPLPDDAAAGERFARLQVSQVMSSPALSVSEDDPLEVAVELLLMNQLSALVVTDADERPVGILTLVDVARAFLQVVRVQSVA